MKDTCLIEYGTVHGDMFFCFVFCCFVNGSKRYIYHSDRLHFVESLPERDAEYQKKYKRIDICC